MSKQVALVLGSGGARGYAHIGVIEELEARGYKIACIAGCSMGAVIGGIYAAGKLPEYKAWTQSLVSLDVLRLIDVSFRLGAMRGDKIFGKIHEIIGDIDIESLPIPFTAVASDLTNHQEIWFQEGCLHQAMRASAAIPSLFTPVIQGTRVLVDGGLLNPLPIVPVVSSHCDLIVAVNLNSNPNKHYPMPVIERPQAVKVRVDQMMNSIGSYLPFRRKDEVQQLLNDEIDALNQPTPQATKSASGSRVTEISGPASLLELITQSFEVMQNSLTQYKIAGYPPDILINIPKRVCRFFEFHRAQELIELGRLIARESLDKYEQDS